MILRYLIGKGRVQVMMERVRHSKTMAECVFFFYYYAVAVPTTICECVCDPSRRVTRPSRTTGLSLAGRHLFACSLLSSLNLYLSSLPLSFFFSLCLSPSFLSLVSLCLYFILSLSFSLPLLSPVPVSFSVSVSRVWNVSLVCSRWKDDEDAETAVPGGREAFF